LPRTYIVCTNPLYGPTEQARQEVRGSADWNYVEIATGHDAMVTEPDMLAQLIADLG
jgi:hypothetical protein